MNDKDLKEDATQAANVDGGKISTFGSDCAFNISEWYKQLFELNDIDDLD